MKASKESIKVDDVIIFRVDEWRDGTKTEFDGNVQSVRDDGLDLIYLSGHRSRNDFIPWSDVIAKVDRSQPRVKLDNAPYSGNFLQFDNNQEG